MAIYGALKVAVAARVPRLWVCSMSQDVVKTKCMSSSTLSTLSSSSSSPSSSSYPGLVPSLANGGRLSTVSGSSSMANFFDRVLDRFPGSNASTDKSSEGRPRRHLLALAYGSGVFPQSGSNGRLAGGKMVDFVLVVDDSGDWHQENLERNPGDYSWLMRRCGAKAIAELQDKFGARLFYNTLVPFEDGKIKYGVMSRSAFVADLLDWESLYVAGRLQKPVRILEKPPRLLDEELHMALRMNLTSALHTALLLLPDKFSEEKLYLTLAGLSYTGDFRMSVGGEDRNKVANIVTPMVDQFRSLYSKRLQQMSEFVCVGPDGGNRMEQDVSPAGRHHHLTMLPKNLQATLVTVWNEDGRWRDVEDVLRAAAFERDSADVVRTCLERVVKRPSITQAVKGVLSAGLVKTVRYTSAKVRKMTRSLQDRKSIAS